MKKLISKLLSFINRSSQTVLEATTPDGFVYTISAYDSTATITGYIGGGGDITIPQIITDDYGVDHVVTSIGSSAFRGNALITGVNIQYGVTNIGDMAFGECPNLIMVTIPNGITNINEMTFFRCYILKSVILPESLISIGNFAFYECNGLESIIIPSLVTSIGDEAFRYCTSLTSIDIPDKVTSIGSAVFSECFGLNTVTIPSSVTKISDGMFGSCSNLRSVSIPDTVTSIGSGAFFYCSGLRSVTIPDLVTSIGKSAFLYCTGLSSMIIPNLVTSIGDYAFSHCSNLSAVTIGSSVNIIGLEAFSYCSNLLSMEIPDNVINMYGGVFKYCSRITTVKLPINLTSISGELFCECNNLGNVTIPSTVNFIGVRAFAYCSSMTIIEIPNNVTSIYEHAFEGCTGLTSMEISDSVTDIDQYAFQYCSNLESVNLSDNIIWLGYGEFFGCGNLKTVNIPNKITGINEYLFSGCYSLVSVNIPDGVTYIGRGAFYGCTSLSDVNIPSRVTSIGYDAFYNCSSLVNVNIPEGVTRIEDRTFVGCTNLTSINIPSSVTSIGNFAFADCVGLTTIKAYPTIAPTAGEASFLNVPPTVFIYIPAGAIGYNVDPWIRFLIIERTVTSIAITTPPNKTSYVEGQIFNPEGMVVEAIYNDESKLAVTGYTIEPSDALSVSDTKVTIYYEGLTVDQSITVAAKSVTSIAITTPPNKTSYIQGEIFNPEGMVVEAIYNDGSKSAVTGYTIEPSGALSVSDTKVTIYYEGLTVDQSITVAAKSVTSIAITTPPNKTSYVEGQSFNPEGMIVEATYTDGSKSVVTGYTIEPSRPLILGDTKVIINYEGNTAEQLINVVAENKVKYVTSITLNGENTSTAVEVNKTLKITASILPNNATDKSVTWSVINQTGQATIDSSGLLTGIMTGFVVVVATANDGSGKEDTLTINVVDKIVSDIILSNNPITAKVNSTLTMSAVIVPDNATNQTVTWSVINKKGTKATINSSSGELSTGAKTGVITITATANDGSGVKSSINITITKI